MCDDDKKKNVYLTGTLSFLDKAGFEKADENHVHRTIDEMTKKSKFYLNALRKEEKLKDDIELLKEKWKRICQEDLAFGVDREEITKNVIDTKIAGIEACRNLQNTYLHVDMDAFFAAVEIRDDSSLENKPVAVGCNSMLSAASYEARKYGVRSAMPGFIARKLCPSLHIVPLNMNKYVEASKKVQNVFLKFDQNCRMLSIDEASLDVTKYLELHDMSISELVSFLKNQVFNETKLTCSVGCAANRTLAKIISNINKPDGQYIIRNDIYEIKSFMEKLSVRKIPGIGKVTEAILASFGIVKCKDILEKKYLLYRMFTGARSWEYFLQMALGVDDYISNNKNADNNEEKARNNSVSIDRSFSPTADEIWLGKKLDYICKCVEKVLTKNNLLAKTISIKIKTEDFNVFQKSKTLQNHVSKLEEYRNMVSSLFELIFSEHHHPKIRLLGIRMSNLLENRDSENINNVNDVNKKNCYNDMIIVEGNKKEGIKKIDNELGRFVVKGNYSIFDDDDENFDDDISLISDYFSKEKKEKKEKNEKNEKNKRKLTNYFPLLHVKKKQKREINNFEKKDLIIVE